MCGFGPRLSTFEVAFDHVEPSQKRDFDGSPPLHPFLGKGSARRQSLRLGTFASTFRVLLGRPVEFGVRLNTDHV